MPRRLRHLGLSSPFVPSLPQLGGLIDRGVAMLQGCEVDLGVARITQNRRSVYGACMGHYCRARQGLSIGKIKSKFH